MPDLENILFAFPDNWVWAIDCPRIKAISKVPGQKKPKTVRYTAFVANEGMIGTPQYASAFADADNYEEALRAAYNDVVLQIEKKKNEKSNPRSK